MNSFTSITVEWLNAFLSQFLSLAGIKKANIAFVIDGSSSEMTTFLQRFVFNMIMMFQQQGSYVTILVYGRDQYRLAHWKEFGDSAQVQVSVLFSIKVKVTVFVR